MRSVHLSVAVSCVVALGCSDGAPITPTSATPPVTLAASHAGAAASNASAAVQTIKIVQGSIDAGPWHDRQSVTLRGTQGFTLEAILGDSEYPGQICRFEPVCVPGATVPLTGQWGGFDLSGSATWRGESFSGVGTEWGAFMTVTGTFVAPPQGETATVTAPFTVTGTIGTPDGVNLQFEGHGTATLELQWDDSLDSWGVVGSRLEFRGAR